MAGISRIKLAVNIFDDEKIKLIESMPDGDAILLIWIHLLCLAGKTNDGGSVYIGQGVCYTDEMLATVCDKPVNTVRLAMQTFEGLEMISRQNGLITIENRAKHQDIDGMDKVREQTRKRVAKHRAKQKALEQEEAECNVTVTLCNATDNNNNKNKNKNKNEIEKKNNNNNNKKSSTCKSNKMTLDDKLIIYYYYDFIKNNTSKSDLNMICEALSEYGAKKVLYVLYYLKEEQRANISSFKYVESTLKNFKPQDQSMVDYITAREFKSLKIKYADRLSDPDFEEFIQAGGDEV